jgi:hypothetical protein
MNCSLTYVHAGAPKQCSYILVKTVANKEIKRLLVGHGNYSSTAIWREKNFTRYLEDYLEYLAVFEKHFVNLLHNFSWIP